MSSPFESSPVPETNKKKDVSYTSLASDEMLFPSAIRTIDSRPTRTNVPLSFKEGAEITLESRFRVPPSQLEYLELKNVAEIEITKETKLSEDDYYGVLFLKPLFGSTFSIHVRKGVVLPFPDLLSFEGELRSVLSIKLTPHPLEKEKKDATWDPRIAVQTDPFEIDVVNVRNKNRFTKSSQKKAKILLFFWTIYRHFVIVTSTTVETYKYSKSQNLRLSKESKHTNINWGKFHPSTQSLLLCTGRDGATLQTYTFTDGGMNQLTRFPLSDFTSPLEKKLFFSFSLGEVDYFSITRPEIQELHIYTFSPSLAPSPIKFERILHINNSQISLNFIDGCLIVHDFSRKISMVFDLKETVSFPIATPSPVLIWKGKSFYDSKLNFFRNDLVFCFDDWDLLSIQINYKKLVAALSERRKMVSFLLRRSSHPSLLLDELKDDILQKKSLSYFASAFDQINAVLSSYMAATKKEEQPTASPKREKEKRGSGQKKEIQVKRPVSFISNGDDEWLSRALSSKEKYSSKDAIRARWSPDGPFGVEEDTKLTEKRSLEGLLVLEQIQIYRHLLVREEFSSKEDLTYLVSIIMEYLRSLNFHHVPPKNFLGDLVVKSLIDGQQYYQLHQFIQYHVITASFPLATQLIALKEVYPPAFQMALDMLKELPSTETIIELLLSHKEVISALKIVQNQPMNNETIQRFFDVADELNDPRVTFIVCRFFERRLKDRSRRSQIGTLIDDHLKDLADFFRGKTESSEEEEEEETNSPNWLT